MIGALSNQIKSVRRCLRKLCDPLESLPDVPDLFHNYRNYCTHPEIRRIPGGWYYKNRFYPDYLTVGGASFAIFRTAQNFCKGYGVDVGAAFWPIPGAIPVDSERGPGVANSPGCFSDRTLDFVFSSHCLEHIEEWSGFLDFWISKLRPGGILFLYLPHPDCEMWHPGSPFVGDGHKWIPVPDTVKGYLKQCGVDIVSCDDGPDAMFSFYVCGQKK